jgi:LysM repeat protein
MMASIAMPAGTAGLGSSSFYEVQPGDTLSSIAERFETSEHELARVNGLSASAAVRAGAQLQVNGF